MDQVSSGQEIGKHPVLTFQDLLALVITEKQRFGRIGDFLGGFRGGADDTQIFVRIKADNGQIKRTEVHHNGDEILEQAFVQNEIVNDFDPPLTQRYEAFRQDMIQKMLEVANNVGD